MKASGPPHVITCLYSTNLGTYQKHRQYDVVDLVSRKLVEIGRFQAAGELHESVDDAQGAIRVYCQGQMFDR